MKFVILAACIAFVCAAPPATKETEINEPIPIISSFTQQEEDGAYKFSFESGNGIQRTETGTIENAGTDAQAVGVQGSYRYIDPNGNPVEHDYSVSNGIVSGKYFYTDANGKEVKVAYSTSEGRYIPSGNIISQEITDLARNAQPYDENEARKLKKQ